MRKKIKQKLKDIYYMRLVLKEDRNSIYTESFTRRMKALKRGFARDKKTLYRYNNKNIKNYLNDYSRFKTKKINAQSSHVFNDKLITERVLSQFVKFPKTYGIIKNKKLIAFTDDLIDKDYKSIMKLIEEKKKVVIKPISEGGGKGVHVLKYECGFFIDDNKLNKEKLLHFIKTLDEYLITEFISQGEYSKELFPDSTNTIRILTMIDPLDNQPFIAKAAQRIGNANTAPIDNFGGGKGGLNAKIDIEKGILGTAVTFTKEGKYLEYDNHPDTKYIIKGKKIPHWEEIKKDLLNVVKKNPFITYCGWDIVVTDQGYSVIEINSYSGMVIFQVHEPILNDERIKRFYKYHGIIK